MNAKNGNPRPAVEWPNAGEVKSVATLDLDSIIKLIDDVKTELNFELSLIWTKKNTREIELVDDNRNDEWALTDGEYKLLKHRVVIVNSGIVVHYYKYEIRDYSVIIITKNDRRGEEENNLTVISKDKNLLREIAKRYKKYISEDILNKFLSTSLTKVVSIKLTETQYENFGEYSELFIDKFRRMLSQVLRIKWDAIKGFSVNGEYVSDEEVQPLLDIVGRYIGSSLDWEDIDYAIISDDTLIKLSFFVDTPEPNISLRVANKNTRVLNPECIKDVKEALYEAYERTLDEGKEKGFGPDDEEFDNALVEWLPTYLHLSSPDEWEWEYK